MNRFSARHHLPLLALGLVLLTLGLLLLFKKPSPEPAPNAPVATARLSPLAAQPDWNQLEVYQSSIARNDFERLLTSIFTVGDLWKNYIQIQDAEALISTGNPPPQDVFHLRFALPEEQTAMPPRHWKSAAELPPTIHSKPLGGLHIAIDPGHIGGAWAKMEERWLVVGNGIPVCEGDMTLHVAQLLKPRLEGLGARVSLVRDKAEPVTPARPETLATSQSQTASNTNLALFYRTAEIHARAELVNKALKPDLVLCLHFNAEAWGDPTHPTLIDHTHFHILLNGGYGNDEVSLADQRFFMLQKILQGTHQEELMVGSSVANTFREITGLAPYQYPPTSTSARPISGQPYLWARNLLANRLYDCPVIFMEPYVMNSSIDYARIQAGDYSGLREFEGKMLPNIFLEYADALTQGLAAHYLKSRDLSESN